MHCLWWESVGGECQFFPFYRISVRPTLNANSFHVGIVGHNFDPTHLVGVQKFIEFFHETTERKDVIFNEVRMLTYWK